MTNYQITLSLLSGLAISGLAGYLGTLMLSKRMSVVAGPLAHLAFPGVALAIVYHFNLAWGVFPFVFLGALFIWWLERKTKLPMENLSAVIFAGGVGTSLLFLPIGEAEEALIGKIGQISLGETAVILSVSLAAFLVVRRIYSQMMLINIHEDLVRVAGEDTGRLNLFYLLSIAAVVALGVFLVGGLITAALIAMPAGASRNVSRGLSSYKFWAVVFGMTETVSGVLLSSWFHLPAGPMVIVSGAAIFVASLIIRIIQSSRCAG